MTAGSKNKVWVVGETLTASALNSNIIMPLSNLDQTDYDSHSLGGTYSDIYTLDIPANQISNYIIVRYILSPWHAATGPASSANIDSIIKINGTSKFTSSYASTGSQTTGNSVSDAPTKSAVYKYNPSSVEKSTGFTVAINARVTGANTYGGSICGIEVWGV